MPKVTHVKYVLRHVFGQGLALKRLIFRNDGTVVTQHVRVEKGQSIWDIIR